MPGEHASLRVHVALLGVQLLFAGFHVVGKAILGPVPPLALAALRVLGTTPLLLVLAARERPWLPRRGDLPMLALLGLLGVTANQVLFILGLERTTATNAAILMPSIPVFAVAVAGALGVERPGPRQIAGIGLAVLGALALLHPTRLVLAPETAVGNALILVNCLSYALFLVLQRPILRRLPWTTVIAWSFAFGGAGVLAVAAPALAAWRPGEVGPGTWLGVAYVVLLATFVGYALSTWAVQRSSPSLVAAYTTLQPFFAALLAVSFLGEAIGWAEVAGFAGIGAGLALVTLGRRGGGS